MPGPSEDPTQQGTLRERFFWLRLVAGFVLVWALLQGTASALGSMRGEAGLAVGALVLLGLLAVEWLFFGTSPRAAALALGLGRPARQALGAAVAIAAILLLYFPIVHRVTGEPIPMVPGWGLLTFGVFAQGGMAEELLFRGYLFRRVRERHSFWAAAWVSMVPFTAVHLLLFATLPVPIATASVLLAVITSFPLARLFDLGRGTVWAPALVHAAMQSLKLLLPPESLGVGFSIGWILLCAIVPFLVFLPWPFQGRPAARGATA